MAGTRKPFWAGHRYIPKPRPKNYNPNFHEYENLKSRWIVEHPASTPEEYQAAMMAIAQRCGI